MKFRWLLHGLLSGLTAALVLSTAAIAGELQFWEFDRDDSTLNFTTTTGVQPTAQLIANPTRLVIDLPGTTIRRTTSRQSLGGLVREVRVGQFNANTARIVIELAPGYTLDPQEIQIRGLTDRRWTVELPDPIQGTVATPGTPPSPSAPTTPDAASPTAATPPPPAPDAPIQLDDIRETPDGLFLRVQGGEPELDIDRDEDDRTITIDVANTALSDRLFLEQRNQTFARPDLSQIELIQLDDTDEPTARIRLTLPEGAPNWDVSYSRVGGLVLIPRRGSVFVAGDRPNRTPVPAPTPPVSAPNADLATIASVLLSSDGQQLQIRSDREVTYTSAPNPADGTYEIRIAAAQLAADVQGPPLTAASALRRVRLRQDGDTVVIVVEPARGIRLGTIRRAESGQASVLVLPLSGTVATTPPSNRIPVTPPDPTTQPQPPLPSAGNLPTVPRGRFVVVVDPGHGGPDPGAVGINGLRETDIVLPISQQVTALLEQQGVQAIITRNAEYDLGLEPRVQLAQRSNATLFVSIHANAISLSRPDVNGLEVYYYSSSASQRLADTVRRSILQTVPVRDRGVRSARFYVLRNTSMPAILVETGFVTGAEDARNLSDPAHRSLLAEAIAQGILTYLQQNY